MMKIGTSDLTTAPLALGSNVFGWTANRDDSFEVLDAFLEGGGNHIDSADGYSSWHPGNSGGEAETIIGEWLNSRGARSRVTIATKVGMHPEFIGLSPLTVRRAAEASLSRLGAEQIDLYYAHADDPDVPLVETAAAFSSLVDSGKIRAIGLSNYSAERVEEWFRIARAENLALPVALQPHYNLMDRDFETNGLLEVAKQENLGVLPYFALAKGFLTGKYRSVNDADAVGASPRAAGATKYLNDRGNKVLDVLDEVSLANDTSVAAVALAWLQQQPGVLAPVSSARNVAQLAPLLESLRLELSDEEVQRLSEASA